MNLIKKTFLMAVLLGAGFMVRGQTVLQPIEAKDQLNDACGKKPALPFSILELGLQDYSWRNLNRLSCDFATGEPLPAAIAETLKALMAPASVQQQKNLKCDIVKPFDILSLFPEKEQQSLNRGTDDTFHR